MKAEEEEEEKEKEPQYFSSALACSRSVARRIQVFANSSKRAR
jgi:hypothetical protein